MPNTFTPEQIAQILEEFFKVVGTRQYIGSRYVPIFGRKDEDSIEWDNTAPYEPLTIVLHQGNSYTSRQYVPVGVEITNQEFWALTGNYNAQVEQYRRETAAAKDAADAAQADIDTLLPKASFSDTQTVKKYVDDLADAITQTVNAAQADIDTLLPKNAFSASETVKDYVDGLIEAITKPNGYTFTRTRYTDGNEKQTDIWYAIIPSDYRPDLILAHDTVNSTEHEIFAAARSHCDVLINAGVWNQNTGDTYGLIIKDGEVLKNDADSSNEHHIIYLDQDGRLQALDTANVTGDAVKETYNPIWAFDSFNAFVRNGQLISSDDTTYQPRSMMAQNGNGDWLVLSAAGRSVTDAGLTLVGAYNFMISVGFVPYIAVNLDGGGSIGLTAQGIRCVNLVANEWRSQANFIGFRIGDMTERDFSFNLPIAQKIVYEMFAKQYLAQPWFDLTSSNNARHFGFRYPQDDGTYKLESVFQYTHSNRTAAIRALNEAGTLADVFSATTEDAKLNGHHAYTEGDNVALLSWDYRNKETNYPLSNDIEGLCKLVAIFFISNAQRYVFYKRDATQFTNPTQSSPVTVAGFIVDEANNNAMLPVTLTFSLIDGVVNVSYTHGSSSNVRLMRLMGTRYY